MTLTDLQHRLRQRIRAAALELFGVEIDQINAEAPPRAELGDLAFPVAFELAKLIKQGTGVKLAPRAIADELKRALEGADDISKIEVAGPGYINVFLDRAALLAEFALASRESE